MSKRKNGEMSHGTTVAYQDILETYRVGANPRNFGQALGCLGEFSVEFLDHVLGSLVEIPRSSVKSEARPVRIDLVFGGCCQFVDGREGFHPWFVDKKKA